MSRRPKNQRLTPSSDVVERLNDDDCRIDRRWSDAFDSLRLNTTVAGIVENAATRRRSAVVLSHLVV